MGFYDWGPIRAISTIFSTLLEWIHMLVPNYGWSIILLTIVFRAALSPLDIKSKLSMKRMSVLQPKLAAINEKYKNDKEKAAQKTMQLYKDEKVSPLSGCLPSLLQLPLFFAFFGALQHLAGNQLLELYNTVKAGGTPVLQHFLWVHNVWQPDTFGTFLGMNSSVIPPYRVVQAFSVFRNAGIDETSYNSVLAPLMDQYKTVFNGWFILPLLSAASSFWMTKLTMPAQTATPDPKAQQNNPMMNSKVMQYMFPVMSLFFTSTANSIFALYWITSNFTSIITYWCVDRYWNAKKRREEEAAQVLLEATNRELEEKKAQVAQQKAERAARKQNNSKGR